MLKLLVVDDEPGIREGLALSLGDLFEVSQASSGAAAMEAIAADAPDLVLLDQKMDGDCGTRVLEQIHERGHRVPVVMLSAMMDVPLAMHSMRLGAQDCLAKPFSVERLREALTAVLLRRPGTDLHEHPFALQVAQIMAAPHGGPEGFEPGRSAFVLRLVQQALEDADGDLEIAAHRLGLEKEALESLRGSIQRSGGAA